MVHLVKPPAVRSTQETVGGHLTHYLEAGPSAGEAEGTVLLLHDGAYGGEASSLVPLMGLLAERFHVVVPDLLGYGRTEKAVVFGRGGYDFRIAHLAGLCDVLSLENVHALGVSYSGSLLLRACAEADPRLPLATVTSINGTGGPWRRPSSLADYDGTLDSMRRLMTLFLDPDAEDFEEWVRVRHLNSLVPGHVAALRAARVSDAVPRATTVEDWPSPLASSQVPILLLSSEDDELLQDGWSQHFEGVVPQLTRATVKGRHLPTLDQANSIASLFTRHVEPVDSHTRGRSK